ncbi:MAG: oxygen-dependent coproporphyrinogen oxidase [Bacteroidetes bacterium]|nr:oxygen-dependent coproporphyrinogen oxidase [Bacteroidota bacterium]MCW5897132.1 oxygen-dependent coproporphyrinogen oxidase [Bacteroidota bacterium]
MPPLGERARAYFEQLQQTLCAGLESFEQEKRFSEDHWERADGRHPDQSGGGGLTRVLEGGKVFEKAGILTSTIFGGLPESLAMKMNVPPTEFYATGVSLIVHPLNPMVPTVHANFRYLEQGNGDSWFGGGTDLTPYYPYDEDIKHFHSVLKKACDANGAGYYRSFKKWCDEYFFIKHRDEARGVGGLFFDYLRGDTEHYFDFVRAVGGAFLEAYLPIVRKRMNEPWGDRERAWQALRRGRYVEFNLVYDRGTTFGLETKGRIESILVSMPPKVEWHYNIHPEPNSREAKLVEMLKSPKDWIS